MSKQAKGTGDLYNSAVKLLVPQSLQATYAAIVKEAKSLIGAQDGSIYLPINNDLAVKMVYTTNPRLYKVKPRKAGSIYTTFNKNRASLRTGMELARHFNEFKKHPRGSNITAPLIFGHISMGALSLLSSPDITWGQDELDLITLFSSVATLAIRKALLKQKLQLALKNRDLFISMVAHELKNPLTSIYLNAQAIQKNVNDGQTPKAITAALLIESTEQLIRLLDELTDTVHIKKGTLKYRIEKCDLVSLIRSCLEFYSKKYRFYKFNFRNKSGQEKIISKADQDKIRQVVNNILNNSIKFSAIGSSITVIISNTKQGVIIKIKDHGVGVDPVDLPHIFGRYNKGSTAKPRTEGIGIGLSLAKDIVEKHHGQLNLESVLGSGTTVTISLPK